MLVRGREFVTSVPSAVEGFSELMTRRLFLLYQIKLAYLRRQQLARSESLSSAMASRATDDPSKVSKVAEVGVRTGVWLMISLLKSVSRHDPELRQVSRSFSEETWQII